MEDNFWRAVQIWSSKPHVVNRKLAGITTLKNWTTGLIHPELGNRLEKLPGERTVAIDEILSSLESHLELVENKHWTRALEDVDRRESPEVSVSLRKCVPKNSSKHEAVYELELVDLKSKSATYVPLVNFSGEDVIGQLMPVVSYRISFTPPETVRLEVLSNLTHDNWLSDILLPKIRKWMTEIKTDCAEPTVQTLQLVPLEDYNALYCRLKLKYSKEIIGIWPECTDPEKFVHEDLAIAAYLLLVWKKERLEKQLDDTYRQSFLDIGCGNGLLVYILASEGHPGKGLDIRARKLWSMYPSFVQLEVSTVQGSLETCFPEFDWLLGNHSDELTPWIPVMALRSSLIRMGLGRDPTRFWVLPCCPFSFFEKFQREKSNFADARHSRYAQFLRFIHQVGQTCGYEMKQDRMRIPSTRRICFVGTSQTRTVDEWKSIESELSDFVQKSSDGREFKPRPSSEDIRNCTSLDRSLQDKVVNLTAKYLLSEESYQGDWNPGTVLELGYIVKRIIEEVDDPEFMKALKSQFGGFQTLLKNHSHIFLVQGGKVRFRSPAEMSVAEWRDSLRPQKKRKNNNGDGKVINFKKTVCWFYQNHPHGCPATDEDCRYLHVAD